MENGRVLEVVPAVETAQIEEIRRLAHIIWREHYPGVISSEQIEYMLRERYGLDALMADLTERGVRYDIARLDDVAVGYSAYARNEAAPEVMLHSLYVRAEQRRSGCGRVLLGRAVDHARALGLGSVVLRVNKHNRVAIAAYERLGFRNRAEIVTDIGEGFVMDDYLMALDLGALRVPGVEG